MRIISWNVNGLRAVMAKGFQPWLARSSAHVVGLQEVRANDDQIAPHAPELVGWHRAFVAAERPGYSGVGLLSKVKPDEALATLGDARFDAEGRFQLARFGRLLVVNAYFPHGGGTARDNSRISYKLAFYRRVFDFLDSYKRKGVPVLVMGDFNTAHREIDLARPKQNQGCTGFTAEEREEFDRWIRSGWVDTFRRYQPASGHYSWWSQRSGARPRNVGWRVDYVLASPGAETYLRGAFIQREVQGSDHCPVGVEVDDGITR